MDSLYRLARQSVPAFVERKKKLIGSQLPRIGGRWLVGWVKREKKRARQLGKTPLKMKFAVKKKTWPFFVQLCWKKLVEGRPIDFHRRARAKTKKKTKNKSKNKEKVKREKKKKTKQKRNVGRNEWRERWSGRLMPRQRTLSTISIDDIDRRYIDINAAAPNRSDRSGRAEMETKSCSTQLEPISERIERVSHEKNPRKPSKTQ